MHISPSVRSTAGHHYTMKLHLRSTPPSSSSAVETAFKRLNEAVEWIMLKCIEDGGLTAQLEDLEDE